MIAITTKSSMRVNALLMMILLAFRKASKRLRNFSEKSGEDLLFVDFL